MNPMILSRRFLGLLVCSSCGLGLGLSIAGCKDDGPPRFDVSGTITFDNQPIAAGVIFFDPDVSKGNDGPQGFAHIKDGRYDTRTGGRGIIGGPHIVRIQGFDGKPGNELPLGEKIFNEHQIAVDLPKETTTKDFQVPLSAKDTPDREVE